jgi:hypothetical protein
MKAKRFNVAREAMSVVSATNLLQWEKDAREYLITKHGDNIAAYDAWGKQSTAVATS